MKTLLTGEIAGNISPEEFLEFPVLLEISDKRLASDNLRVNHLYFSPGDARKLPTDIIGLDAATGVLYARVVLPVFRPGESVRLTLIEGESPYTRESVEDIMLQIETPDNDAVFQPTNNPATAITVEAWIRHTDGHAETIQPIISQWPLASDFSAFSGYDMSHTDGMDTTGYFGGTFDGRYVYFAPQHDKDNRHGKAVRYDTHGGFTDAAGWEAFDAGNTDNLNTKGYYGACFDGRYVYYMPRRNPDGFHSNILRYDTRGKFKEQSSWQAFDCNTGRSTQSLGFDGRYIYMCPGARSVKRKADDKRLTDGTFAVTGMADGEVVISSGLIVRFDTQSEFKHPASYQQFNAETLGENVRDFDGAVFDGRYIYFVPLCFGRVLRYDTHGDFESRENWQIHDAGRLGMTACVGGIFDGRYVYFVPYGECASVVRLDTTKEFTHLESWSAYDIRQTPGLAVTGYDGAFFDGRHVYLIPYYQGDTVHGVMLRYDTSLPFTSVASWVAHDAGRTGGLKTTGFNAGVSDGRYLYCAPWLREDIWPGAIGGAGHCLRYDTTGDDAVFSLRYSDIGHNGGLTAALPGARFLVNTVKGPISIAANALPEPGDHYIVGVYDGTTIALYINGTCVNRQSASGRIAASNAPIRIGHLVGRSAKFNGQIQTLRVSTTARNDTWIAAQYHNSQNPAASCTVIN